jgi:hypothetical protein
MRARPCIALLLLLALLGQPLLALAVALHGPGSATVYLDSPLPVADHEHHGHHHHHAHGHGGIRGDAPSPHHDNCEHGGGPSAPCPCPVNAPCGTVTTPPARILPVVRFDHHWFDALDSPLCQRAIDVEPRPPRQP